MFSIIEMYKKNLLIFLDPKHKFKKEDVLFQYLTVETIIWYICNYFVCLSGSRSIVIVVFII